MEKVKTATGKEFECESFSLIEDPKRVYIRIRNIPISTVATVFSDPRETVQLYYGDVYVSQFTKLLGIIPENGMIRVNLTKE
jgi:hypothetical protein